MSSFWLEDPTELFRNLELLPNPGSNIASKLNALTRLAVVVGLGIYLLNKDSKESSSLCIITFGVLLLFIVITAYYSKSKEGFRPPPMPVVEKPTPTYPPSSPTVNLSGLQATPLWYDPKYGAGPKEYRDPPVIPPNPADAKFWGGFQSRINEPRPQIIHSNVESVLFKNEQPYSQRISLPSRQRKGFKILGGPHQDEPEIPFVIDDQGLNPPNYTRIRGYSMHDPSVPPYSNLELLSPSQSFVPGAQVPSGRSQLHAYDDFANVWSAGNTDFLTSKMAIHRTHPAVDTGEFRQASTIGLADSMYNPTFKPFDPASTYFKTSNNPYDGLFIGRSLIEHVDMRAPNGEVLPGYLRMGFTSDDFMDEATSRQEADELYFREAMVADVRARMNEREQEFRMAPVMNHFM